MKLQTLALGLALTVAGSAFAATQETTVTRETPHGTVTKHIVRTTDRHEYHPGYPHPMRKVVVVKHPTHHYAKKVVIVHPPHHGRDVANRTVVIHRHG